MNWIKSNFKVLALLLTVILIILVVADVFMRSNRIFDDTRFNNIITPIAAIVSVLLFSYLTLEQLREQRSNSLKQNYEESFDQLRNELRKSIKDRVTMIVGIKSYQPYDIPEMDSVTYTAAINNALDRISMNQEFIVDHSNFLSNRDNRILISSLMSRSYFGDLEFVLAFAQYPTFKYNLIESFIDEINASHLLRSDRIHFKRKVESELLNDYFQLVMHRGGFELPDFHNREKDQVPWRSYRTAGIDKFFAAFRQKLSY